MLDHKQSLKKARCLLPMQLGADFREIDDNILDSDRVYRNGNSSTK
jgi:hypothetical protein